MNTDESMTDAAAQCHFPIGDERGNQTCQLMQLADAVATALQDMGDFWAYGMAKAENAEPSVEDHKAVYELSKRARIALDAYRALRRMT